MDIRAEITRLLRPPKRKIGATGDWKAAEKQLGSPFPDDYKWFIESYGSGTISEFFWIHSPFAKIFDLDLWSWSAVTAANLRSFYADGLIEEPGPPFAMYPEPGGLFSFGSTENANYFNWKTKGPPDKWTVVVWDPDFLRLNDLKGVTLSKLIYEVVSGKILSRDLFHPDWAKSPKEFIPSGV